MKVVITAAAKADLAEIGDFIKMGFGYRRLEPYTTPNNKLYGFTISKDTN
jgi:hypothetical protein